MGISSTNPATGEVVREFVPLSAAEVELKLERAVATFETYRHSPFDQRAAGLRATADLLEARQQELAQTMSLEMGKLLRAGVAEVEKCALLCRFYADHGEAFLADVPVQTEATRSFVRYQPLGPVLAVMPWNFPFWQVFRFAAPALMAGNVGLLKHASNVPQCALAIESILLEAGFPEGAFQTLLIGSDQVAGVIADQRVVAATLTGSEAAGISLAKAAGQVLKPTLLELGGSDAFVVTEQANLELAIAQATLGRLQNNGQTCIAAKRFILLEAIATPFLQGLVANFEALTIGDPLEAGTDLGPLATPGILQELEHQVQVCVDQGAKVWLGGDRASLQATLPLRLQGGNFYPATLLSDLPPGCPAYQEEFFGPVALVFRVQSLDEAIALANATSFGLGASAWTEDLQEQERCIQELEAGAVFINCLVKSDPRLPFGGIKRSGYGRELGVEGIRAFMNAKTAWVN
ncbi:MAG: NAD-dependent succinate-semialdehyde dehydrogenase [Synechococcales cyanobacterium CRU_2_2]|nr:NAD-dependent succinate-semialdehyde dehydrogenase [Synechococcales cyanobacterium CRU_2_2]